MKSNGFGRLVQTIIIHVPKEHTQQFASKLGVHPFKEEGNPARAYFSWKRLTTRKGNDEDVVYDLYIIFDDIDHERGWKIDWDASEY